MIISASRRTDIPTYYSEWLFNRLKEEYVLVRNPMNIHQIGRINLSPDVVDGIVFWTKNPVPMLSRLSELDGYHYYFQFTLNAYDTDVEPNLPSKNKIIIPAFQKLSQLIGREKVIWRYDPILFNDRYTMEYHCKYFKVLAQKLGDYTEKCTISFLDWYRNTARNTQPLKIRQEKREQQFEILQRFSDVAEEYGFYIDTCAEAIESDKLGISHAHCIDKERLERIGKCKLAIGKDPNQRTECGCIASIDIGTYNTCKNGCLYCYANYSHKAVMKNTQVHNPASPLLFGEIGADDVIKERKAISCKEYQMTLLDL
ncbi:MAG: DUF1848 domain-containing protein [Lachnospiraceae bacterium]|jgi:hypothetical protein|nr:DUF1848 domain-containing protein [Lachnospiraceae bacterium]